MTPSNSKKKESSENPFIIFVKIKSTYYAVDYPLVLITIVYTIESTLC